jgi:tetratricopeptide (TPR) repeat protein
VTIIAVGVLLLIFRKEFDKILNWLVGFKRIAKTKDGYSASTAPESSGSEAVPPLSDNEQFSDKKQLAIEETKTSKPEDNEPDTDWSTPFLAKDYTQACEILRDMITREKDPQKRTGHRTMLGYVMLTQNKQKGMEYFEDLIRTGDNAATVYHWYGQSLYWNGDYPKAADVLLAGLKQHSEAPELSDLLATVLRGQGKHFQAIETLLTSLRKNPTFAGSYKTLTEILIDLGMSEQALNCCRVGMRHCPIDTDLLEKYAKILPEPDVAKSRMFAYLRLTEIKPQNPTYWTLLGNEYLRLDFHDMAIEAYHKGNTLAKEKETWILANIGNIMNNRGFYSRGAEFLQRAISIEPNSQYAHERLGQALKNTSDQQAKRDEIRSEIYRGIRDAGTLDSLLEQVRGKLAQQPAPNGSI